MICNRQISFDAHSQETGFIEDRIIGEELLAEKEPLQVINSFFCRLPFRLRLGSRAVFEVKCIVPARIVVINSVDIPNPKFMEESLGKPPCVNPEMASDLLITLSPVNLNEDMKSDIVKVLNDSEYAKESANLSALQVDLEDLLKPINTLVTFYRILFGQEIRWNRVRQVLRKDISGGQTCKLHVFRRQHDPDDFNLIENSIADVKLKSPIPFRLCGHLHDIPEDNITKLQYKLKHETLYAYYSMVLQAESHIQQTDYLNALLYSVIAFENAHSELVEHIAETKAGCKNARKWAQNLLREAGISSMVRLTPYLFIEPENRPSEDTIKDVVRAIEIRNELAHAKRDKNSNLKVETHRCKDLLPLIESVFDYINAIARQLPD